VDSGNRRDAGAFALRRDGIDGGATRHALPAWGWTVRQVVHHLADSHLNAYTRFRLALTEDEPSIKTYNEKNWAELSDARTAPAKLSLSLLETLHARFVLLLRSLKPADFARAIKHPEMGRVTIERYLGLYAWHGRHYVAHVGSLRARKGW